MTNEMKKHIETLIAKAAKADLPNEAMQYAQAASNAAQAVLTFISAEKR